MYNLPVLYMSPSPAGLEADGAITLCELEILSGVGQLFFFFGFGHRF